MTWRDTIDDWDAVLAAADTERSSASGATAKRRSSASNTDNSGDDDDNSIRSDGGSAVTRIGPMSDTLLDATLDVLPEAWQGDRRAQQLVQWVVYAFVEETTPSRPSAARAGTAIAYAADRTDTNPTQLKQLCTTGLYRDRRGSPQAHLTSDLETIDERTRVAPTATAT